MGFARGAAQRLAGTGAFRRAVSVLESGDRRPNVLRVLTYHRVVQPEQHPYAYPGVISATPAEFARQMAAVATGYRVVSIEQVLEAFAGATELPPRAVLITFDDAYQDFAETAWPTLRQLRLPVVLFVPTAYPDQPQRTFWWDRLHRACLTTEQKTLETPVGLLRFTSAAERRDASRRLNGHTKSLDHDAAMRFVDEVCDRLRVSPGGGETMTWDELRKAAGEGVSLAPHTQTHPLMHRLTPQRAQAEAAESWRELQREVDHVAPAFAYPGGGHNEAVVEGVRAAGFSLAFTTVSGANSVPQTDPMRIARINVSQQMSAEILRARMQWSRRSAG